MGGSPRKVGSWGSCTFFWAISPRQMRRCVSAVCVEKVGLDLVVTWAAKGAELWKLEKSSGEEPKWLETTHVSMLGLGLRVDIRYGSTRLFSATSGDITSIFPRESRNRNAIAHDRAISDYDLHPLCSCKINYKWEMFHCQRSHVPHCWCVIFLFLGSTHFNSVNLMGW